MSIIVYLGIFVVLALLAAADGDTSGIEAIGKIIGGIVLFFIIASILT